jgi:hypothetical protein
VQLDLEQTRGRLQYLDDQVAVFDHLARPARTGPPGNEQRRRPLWNRRRME